ncbi:MAG TPA: hypothetical protein DF383_12730 [Deltaproteobacteria bacterium]|nr:hypothetical protein [Deltaproteobacteria bacterium]
MTVKVETNLSKLPTWLKTSSSGGAPQVPAEGPQPKTLGETPPLVVRLSDYPELVHLFTHYGAIQKARRKLRLLSGKNGKVLLAKNTVGAADNLGNVYLGVEFLEEYGGNDALLHAVMAHEWGHLISNTSKHGNLDHLSWDEIFKLRREEEAAADVFCGRMLAMMGYPPDAIVDFLMRAENGNDTLKYYAAPIRGAIIQEAHRLHAQRSDLTQKLFKKSIYPNPYTSRIILADE